MAKTFYGISAINASFRSRANSTIEPEEDIISVRVTDIILDNSHPRFEEYGEWNSIGTIFFDNTEVPGEVNPLNVARPLYSNQKLYPLINELVPLVFLTSVDSQLNTNRKTPYYLPPINLWNSQHHNALPDPTTEVAQASLDDYEQAERGVVRRVEDQSTEIDLGEGFNEKIGVHPLQPFIGDNIFEGRWGNSIRLGSTAKDKNNNWSSAGENGDPLIIIRNGQRDNVNEDSWVPISEKVNEDKASIYLTNGQKIPIEVANTTYDSHQQPPTNPKEYTSNQIILNSGRLVLNAQNDNLILSAKDSVSISSPALIGIDSNKLVVVSEKIYLGDKDESQLQPILRGDNTVEVLIDAFTEIAKWMELFQEVPDDKLSAQASTAKQLSFILKKSVIPDLQNKCRSKQNFTQ